MQPTSQPSSPGRSPRTRARTVRAAAPLHHGDPETPTAKPVPVKRRKLRLKRSLTKWEWLGFGLSVVACVSLWPLVLAAHSNLSTVSLQVEQRQVQLDALERQKAEEQGRLAHLKSEKGREQLLVERGYLKPGDRFLLFPDDSTKP
jgi:heme exporter protein D